jgi:serine/threonine-protein kinase
MSTEIDGTVRIYCAICDAPPAIGAAAGTRCAACGSMLVRHVERTDDLLGTVIDGRFEVLAPLGHGGMGRVYRAMQRSVGREVALKIIDRQLQTDPSSVKRFLREAKLSSRLAHPNTIGAIDFGQTADGMLYLVLELVRGKTLDAILEAEGPLPASRIGRIGVQICDALEAAHALSIVHRDLKLENIMVLDGGRDLVKVLDFGLALSLQDQSRATATGLIAGTPRYLAPEIVKGDQPAPAQDLYALGVVLGELATGQQLFAVENFAQMFAQKMDANPSLDGVEARLQALVRKLIDPDPARRPLPTDARGVLRAIEDGWVEIPEVSGVSPAFAPTDPRPVVGTSPPTKIESPQPQPKAVPPPTPIAMPGELQLVALDGTPHEELGAGDGPRAAGFGQTPAPKPKPDPKPHPAPAPEPHQTFELAVEPPRSPKFEVAQPTPEPRGSRPVARSPQPAARSPQPAARSLAPARRTGVILALALVAGGAVGVYFATRRAHHGTAQQIAPGQGITIHVVTPHDGVPLMVDGDIVGSSPVDLMRSRGTRPITLSATIDDQPYTKQIVPDRDQTVELGP